MSASLDIDRVRESLCASLCKDVRLFTRPDGRIGIDAPLTFPDGDEFVLFIEPMASGGLRVTDHGHTLMHLSYSMDVDDILEGNRGEIFQRILAEAGVAEENGALRVEVPADQVGPAVFRLGQAITRVHDITFLNRARVASTFYEDLSARVAEIVPAEQVQRPYLVPGHPEAPQYPVDIRIETRDPAEPIFMFGVPGAEKAKLTALILEHWLRKQVRFTSFLVFADQATLPRQDVARLSNVGDEMVASLGAVDDLTRKLNRLRRAA